MNKGETLKKAIGIFLCVAAVVALVAILVLTADIRAQKSVINDYFLAVKSHNDTKIAELCTNERKDGCIPDYAEFEAEYGKNVKYVCDLEKVIKSDENVVSAQVTLTISGDDKTEKKETDIVMVKENGKWKIDVSPL